LRTWETVPSETNAPLVSLFESFQEYWRPNDQSYLVTVNYAHIFTPPVLEDPDRKNNLTPDEYRFKGQFGMRSWPTFWKSCVAKH
jgi:hypothetical protein